jgi:hypothetical protein
MHLYEAELCLFIYPLPPSNPRTGGVNPICCSSAAASGGTGAGAQVSLTPYTALVQGTLL